MEKKEINLSSEKVTRTKEKEVEEKEKQEPVSVSAGVIERIADYAFNATREKIREMTSINRMQAMLLPQLDLVGQAWRELIEIVIYRQDSIAYLKLFKQKQPIPFDPIDEYIYRFAQWSKSRDAMNLKSAMDLALAEVEAEAGEKGLPGGADVWEDK